MCCQGDNDGTKWRLKPNTSSRQKQAAAAAADEQTTTAKPSQPVTSYRMMLDITSELTLRQQVTRVPVTSHRMMLDVTFKLTLNNSSRGGVFTRQNVV